MNVEGAYYRLREAMIHGDVLAIQRVLHDRMEAYELSYRTLIEQEDNLGPALAINMVQRLVQSHPQYHPVIGSTWNEEKTAQVVSILEQSLPSARVAHHRAAVGAFIDALVMELADKYAPAA